MKRFLAFITACFCLVSLCACHVNKKNEPSASEESQSISSQAMSSQAYETLEAVFKRQYTDVMTQMQNLTAAYTPTDDWWQQYEELKTTAQKIVQQFVSNQAMIPPESVDAYNTLLSAINAYTLFMDKMEEVKNADAGTQQQKLSEASQLLMQANSQWQLLQ